MAENNFQQNIFVKLPGNLLIIHNVKQYKSVMQYKLNSANRATGGKTRALRQNMERCSIFKSGFINREVSWRTSDSNPE